jgi:dolichol-phosphate mannosyltransferase
MKISVIVPTYNEKGNMYPLIERIDNSMKDFDHEIIVVDDNSPDGTAQVVEDLAKKYPIKLIVRKNEKGLATAVIEGFKHSSGDVYAVIDADLQHPPETLKTLVWEASNGTDIAIGSRYNGGEFGGFSKHRKIMSKGAKKIAKILVPKLGNISDVQSGFFAIKKEVVKNAELSPKGYKILLEILAMGDYKVVKEIPYQFGKREYGKSKLGAGIISDYLYHLISILFREKESKRLIKFMATGVAGIAFSVGLLWFLTERGGMFYLISGLVSKESAILFSFVANEYWVFNDRIKPSWKESAKRCVEFNINRAFSMFIVLAVMAVFTQFIGINYLLSNFIGIAIAFPFNYIASNKWIWNKEKNNINKKLC